MNGQFGLGSIHMTRRIAERIAQDTAFAAFVEECLARYRRHEWGDLLEDEAQENEEAIRTGNDNIFADYKNTDGTRVWIITKWDQSATRVLFPGEYLAGGHEA